MRGRAIEMIPAVDYILRNLRRNGWAVSVHLMSEYVEMHAVKLDALDDPPKIARCGDGDDDLAQLTCAKVLAEMCHDHP